MPKLERLRADHDQAILAFERDNREYFAASISDRGEEFFDRFAERYRDLLAEQEAGTCAFYVLVEDGAVIGRFNLYDLENGTATVGYRVARQVAGHGVATATVRELCAIAAGLGLHTLAAATTQENVASQKVLTNAGFVPAGPAHPSELGGKHGTRYQCDLTVAAPGIRCC